MSRSLLLFESAIKSEETKAFYRWTLLQFLKYTKIADYDGLLTLKESALQIMVEDYLFEIKKKISPNSIPGRLASIELFLAMNDKVLNWKKIRKMFPAKIKKSGSQAYTNEQIAKMLQSTTEKRNRFLIHYLASTGTRIGSIEGLQIKHLSEIADGCTAILVYAGTNSEYWSFLTPEATLSMNEYFEQRRREGEYLDQNSPVFRSQRFLVRSRITPFTKQAAAQVMMRILKHAQIRGTKTGQRFDIMLDHGFRKRFDDIIKTGSQDLTWAEKLMGHEGVFKLDGTYVPINKDKAFKEFSHHVNELTIDNAARERIAKENAISQTKNLQEDRTMMRDLLKEVQEIKLQQARHQVMNQEKEQALLKKITELENKLKS